MKNIDPILRSDLNHIANLFPHWEELAGKAVLVTGATGLVGSMLVRALCAAPSCIFWRMSFHSPCSKGVSRRTRPSPPKPKAAKSSLTKWKKRT